MTTGTARRWSGAAVALAAVLAGGAEARAQACDDEAFVRAGFARTDAGDHEAALAQFTQAWERCHQPRARAQMALAENRLRRWVDAETHLREALEARNDAWIRPRRRALEDALALISQHIGSLDVRGTPAGAEVRVNGAAAGTLPLAQPLRVAAGTVAVEVRAEGYAPVTRQIAVTAGAVASETFELAPVAAVAQPIGNGGGGEVSGPVDRPSPPSTLRTVGFVGLGLGAVLAAGGGAALILREVTVGTFGQRCWVENNMVLGGGDCMQLYERGNSLAPLGVVGLVAGGVVVAASLALVIAAPRAGARPAAANGAAATARGPSVACAPAGAGVACGGVF